MANIINKIQSILKDTANNKHRDFLIEIDKRKPFVLDRYELLEYSQELPQGESSKIIKDKENLKAKFLVSLYGDKDYTKTKIENNIKKVIKNKRSEYKGYQKADEVLKDVLDELT